MQYYYIYMYLVFEGDSCNAIICTLYEGRLLFDNLMLGITSGFLCSMIVKSTLMLFWPSWFCTRGAVSFVSWLSLWNSLSVMLLSHLFVKRAEKRAVFRALSLIGVIHGCFII
jgi:hypothetical protein